jgi:lysophospholipase L1-like esterase
LRRSHGWSVLVATVVLALPAPGAARAQTSAPAGPPAPTLQIVSATLRQVDQSLELRLRFSREFPVKEIDPRKGRFACLVLGPSVPTRRRVCVSRGDGRLRASMTRIEANGKARGRALALRRATVQVDGDVLELRASASSLRVKTGHPVTWQALVSWKDGGPCEAAGTCTQVVPGSGVRSLRTRAPRQATFVGTGRLRLLATGDSMIQIIDSFLKARLERRRATRVRSDARISTGLSKPFMLDWVKKAREQARSVHPDVTAMFIGANDGFPMKTRSGATVPCCRAAWTAEYARRVESMMRSYLRGGRSYVYWLTLPTPRRGDFARIYRAVNRAIKRAAVRVGRGVRVIDLVKVFTPGGRFRQYVRFRGKTVNARQGDGVHLSTAGASIAATLLIDRLRVDHALTRLK